MKAERDRLAKDGLSPQGILGRAAAAAQDQGADKKAAEADDDDDEDASEHGRGRSLPEDGRPLRETLRVLDDAIDLGQDHEYWASDHAPLTIASKG